MAINATDIDSIIELACEANGIDELSSKISVKTSSRLKTTGGKAYASKNLITVGIAFWEAATEEEKEQLIYHEICHIITWYIFKKRGHGLAWKNCMINCNVKPERCHHVKTTAMKTGFCKCGEKGMGSIRYKRMVNEERKYICCTCKSVITEKREKMNK